MKYKTMMLITCAVLVFSGLAVLVFPSGLVSLYGADLSGAGSVLARSFGASYLSLAILAWHAKDAQEKAARRIVSLSLAVCFGLGSVIFIIAQLQHVFNALGWLDVILNGPLFLGHLYFVFRPGVSQGT
ncbi:MAG: hypothetical protein KGY39_00195 [Anaerolineales bacterium]|nr:hypothetical protein [Anaerolineales bacterium]MBS3752592.1 hypothetical protein [Anaerolineales bacterium]